MEAAVEGRSEMTTEASNRGVIRVASIAITGAVAVTAITVPGPTVITMPPVAVIPRTRADKDAVRKPARTVIAVRSAGIWVIRVVTIGANRSRTNTGNHGTHANTHRDLCASASSEGEKQNT
jgi:hypothetical protein